MEVRKGVTGERVLGNNSLSFSKKYTPPVKRHEILDSLINRMINMECMPRTTRELHLEGAYLIGFDLHTNNNVFEAKFNYVPSSRNILRLYRAEIIMVDIYFDSSKLPLSFDEKIRKFLSENHFRVY